MRISKIVQYVTFWFLGVLVINKLWMPYLLKVTTNPEYLIHGAIWPVILWTICFSIIFGIVITQ